MAKKKVQATLRIGKEFIDKNHKYLSVSRQCKLLGISRGKYYYRPKNVTAKQKEKEVFKAFVVQTYFKYPFYGHRRINEYLKSKGVT